MFWLKEYKWLVYSFFKDGGFCWVCFLFLLSFNIVNMGVFVSFVMIKFNKVNEILKEYFKMKYYNDVFF